jgi:hypothetical protein
MGEWQWVFTNPGRSAPSTRTSRVPGAASARSAAGVPTRTTVSPATSTAPGRRAGTVPSHGTTASAT